VRPPHTRMTDLLCIRTSAQQGGCAMWGVASANIPRVPKAARGRI